MCNETPIVLHFNTVGGNKFVYNLINWVGISLIGFWAPNLCHHNPTQVVFVVSRTQVDRKNCWKIAGFDPVTGILIETFGLSLLYAAE